MYLLYCIFHSCEVLHRAPLPGVGGQLVFPVTVSDIGVAVSEISNANLAPDIPRIMAYQKVIESFQNDRTVIPMRYGCVLRGRPQVIQFLNENARRHELLLKELDGSVEMGIRILIEDLRNSEFGARNLELEDFEPNSAIQNQKSKISGQAYLAVRKEHYAQEKHITEAINEIAEKVRVALTGLFVKCIVETLPMINHQSSMLSLYFLVPEKSIDPFRRVFRHLHSKMETAKLLLSGPWPPYNFVLPDNDHRRLEIPEKEAKER